MVPKLNVDLDVEGDDLECIHCSTSHPLTFRHLQALIDNQFISLRSTRRCGLSECDAPATSAFTFTLQLRDTFPCFDLSQSEDTETEHYHSDKLRHVYIDNNQMTEMIGLISKNVEAVTTALQGVIDLGEELEDYDLDAAVFELNLIYFNQ